MPARTVSNLDRRREVSFMKTSVHYYELEYWELPWQAHYLEAVGENCWRCRSCGQEWEVEPLDRCLGKPIFTNEVAATVAGYRSYSAWLHLGRWVSNGNVDQPAAYHLMSDGQRVTFLYSRAQVEK